MRAEPAEVALAVGRFFRAVDSRDWNMVAALLADHVDLDYTSVFAGVPERLAASEVIDRWRALLPGFDATQHFLGPLLGTGDGLFEANVRGYHHLGGQTWMVAGWYRLNVRETAHGVSLAGIALDVSYETGSRDLVELAGTRAAS
jgi:hypothetical protein